MSNPNLVEIYIEGYPMPIYDDGRATKPWITDFNKMKIFDGHGAELSQIGRRSDGVWFFGRSNSKNQSQMPTAVATELEQAYIKWLNREITG